MGFIPFAECEIMHNNALINIHMTHTAAAMGVRGISSPHRSASTGICSPANRR